MLTAAESRRATQIEDAGGQRELTQAELNEYGRLAQNSWQRYCKSIGRRP
jgi:hypothetical protein